VAFYLLKWGCHIQVNGLFLTGNQAPIPIRQMIGKPITRLSAYGVGQNLTSIVLAVFRSGNKIAMRSRCLLHKNKLEEFEKWLKARGWVMEPTKGTYEYMRATHPKKKGTLLVYARENIKEHYTVFGESLDAAHQFIREQKGIVAIN
jgi:predicted RNA binding protein YcfA (HicA-like mRNA interferase family)